MSDDIIAPIIHLNGTSKERLLHYRDAAYIALENAAQALLECGPNGRDYYPKPGLMAKAEDQHRRRLQSIRNLQAEIEREIELIQEQGR